MDLLKHPGVKRARRIGMFVLALAAALYLAPVVVVALILCGVIDVSRHRVVSAELLEKYFAGNGILTWILSPINLLADLISYRNPGIYRLSDLPTEHRREVEACVRAFVENGDRIKDHIAKVSAQNKRSMLTFKWFGAPQSLELRIPAFERDYLYIKTIAVSVFNTRERTSRHFGPMRLTFRVLYNLEPVNSRDVFIEVDGVTHYWTDDPLFIFDDTMFHRSINDVDHVRYCLFMDMVRPNHFQAAFTFAVPVASFVAGSFKRLFYRNWSFVR